MRRWPTSAPATYAKAASPWTHGVRKGKHWFRCKPCVQACQRVEAAKGTSEAARRSLAQIKKSPKEWVALVMRERAAELRGRAGKRKLGAYLEEPPAVCGRVRCAQAIFNEC